MNDHHPITRQHVLAAVESILTDPQPSPAALRWLRQGFGRHLETAEPLSVSLGIARTCPQGLPFAIRNQRFAACIHRAVAALEPTGSVHSTATLIGRELARLSRRRRSQPATSAFEAALLDALEVHPNAPTATSTLWPIVRDGIEQRAVQTVSR